MTLRQDNIKTTTSGNGAWQRYIVAVFATILCMLAAYIGSLVALRKVGRLPPPAIVNEICADEKLMWLRQNPPQHPDFLMVGSSIAWRDIDSQQLVANHVAKNPLNGGFCHLETNQAVFTTKFFLQHFPSIKTVATVVVPQDFLDCAKGTAELFNPNTVNAYVFAHQWAYSFYIRQFDPVSLARNAFYVRGMRDGQNKFDSLEMTQYGDGPLKTHAYMGLMYGGVPKLDPRCFAAMRQLALTVGASGRQLFVSTAPLNAAWLKLNDPTGRQNAELVAEIKAALHGTGAMFWDGNRAFPMTQSSFTDAIHLNWSAARDFTARLAEKIVADGDKA